MDSLVAFKGKDYVIMAADTFNAYSILRMKVTNPYNHSPTMIKYGTWMAKR